MIGAERFYFTGKFGAFAYYCWIAGAIFLVLSLLGVTFVHA